MSCAALLVSCDASRGIAPSSRLAQLKILQQRGIRGYFNRLLGISDKVAALRDRPDYNQYSVRLELQADFLAGVWAKHSQKYLEEGDIEEAMRAANAIGDDAIQKKMEGRVVPHAFTHGTSEQRTRWFTKGLKSGRIEDGDTFSMQYQDL